MIRWILCHLGQHQPLLWTTHISHPEIMQYDQPQREWASPTKTHKYFCARQTCGWRFG